jgi:hypothetical protein
MPGGWHWFPYENSNRHKKMSVLQTQLISKKKKNWVSTVGPVTVLAIQIWAI